MRATKRLGPPLLVSGLEHNKEIAVTRSRAPVRHLQTAVWPGANTGYEMPRAILIRFVLTSADVLFSSPHRTNPEIIRVRCLLQSNDIGHGGQELCGDPWWKAHSNAVWTFKKHGENKAQNTKSWTLFKTPNFRFTECSQVG